MSNALPPALLVHGAGGGAWEWQIWQRVFATQGVSTHALTLQPYPGDSAERGFPNTSYALYLQQVQAELQRSGAKILIGASLGGLLAAELAGLENCVPSIDALVLVAPIPPRGLNKAGPTKAKRWAASADLLNSARALPDADAAGVLYAHQNWRDESQHVLCTAYAGRDFNEYSGPTLTLLAQNEKDLSNDHLRQWANASRHDVMQIDGASHAGLLLGRHASNAAETALMWLRSRRVGLTKTAQ